MIIDSHVHLVDHGWIREDFFYHLARVVAANMGKETGESPDARFLVEAMKDNLMDSTGEKLINTMDEAGVDRSCVFPVDYGPTAGNPKVPIEDQNRAVSEAVQKFPDRLWGFFAVDPRREKAVEMFSRGIEKWGLHGLKLHPAGGFYPYQEVAYPLYEKCVEYGVPVIIHTGSQPPPMKSRFCRPVYVDDVAADFPDLPIIMAHCGHHWWEEALMVASVKPNCYVDISGWQRGLQEDPRSFYVKLRHILDALGPWRVFWGSDGPYLNAIYSLPQWLNAMKNPASYLSSAKIIEPESEPESEADTETTSGDAETEVTFTSQEMEIITGKAFARLM